MGLRHIAFSGDVFFLCKGQRLAVRGVFLPLHGVDAGFDPYPHPVTFVFGDNALLI